MKTFRYHLPLRYPKGLQFLFSIDDFFPCMVALVSLFHPGTFNHSEIDVLDAPVAGFPMAPERPGLLSAALVF